MKDGDGMIAVLAVDDDGDINNSAWLGVCETCEAVWYIILGVVRRGHLPQNEFYHFHSNQALWF